MDGRGGAGELVVVALPGVQDFIAEAQSTSDVHASSDIYAALADRVVEVFGEAGGELILPGQAGGTRVADAAQRERAGTPNRIVALFPAGTGAAAGRQAAAEVSAAWRGWVERAMGVPMGKAPATPGFPLLHWVCVPGEAGEYEVQWGQAQRLLAARRRIRDFPAVPEEEWRKRRLCSLAPRWPAESHAPRGVPEHERSAALSAAGWVKRRWRQMSGADGFPSTSSIASAPYRLPSLSDLHETSGTYEISVAK